MSVTCEPNQRAIVRQVAVAGAMQAQVACESVAAVVGTSGSFDAVAPVAYQPVAAAPDRFVASAAPAGDARLVRTSYPATRVVSTEAAPERVVYQRAPERVVHQPKRSVKKSAVIIGSSAGVGAGIGAAVGGKKGAGIGALIGGGGAALWDQITRRKQ